MKIYLQNSKDMKKWIDLPINYHQLLKVMKTEDLKSLKLIEIEGFLKNDDQYFDQSKLVLLNKLARICLEKNYGSREIKLMLSIEQQTIESLILNMEKEKFLFVYAACESDFKEFINQTELKDYDWKYNEKLKMAISVNQDLSE